MDSFESEVDLLKESENFQQENLHFELLREGGGSVFVKPLEPPPVPATAIGEQR